MVSRATCELVVAATVAGATIKVVAEADLDVSRLLVAVIAALLLWVPEGEVKRPVGSMMPTAELPPAIPLTAQMTPELSPVTVAVNCAV